MFKFTGLVLMGALVSAVALLWALSAVPPYESFGPEGALILFSYKMMLINMGFILSFIGSFGALVMAFFKIKKSQIKESEEDG